MNYRQKKKKRKRLYKELIEDVALEISLDACWRKRIMEQLPNIEIRITYHEPDDLPKYIQKDIVNYKLEFGVMKVKSCKEHFDEGLEIFKFQSKEYPVIVRFTGNNASIGIN